MISLALVIPLTMISLMTFITSAIFTFNFSATSAILSQTSLERASVHLKFFAISMSLAWTILKISLALVTPFAIASRIILSTSAALILNNSAAARNFLHISAERTSSQVITLMSSPSTPGKKCFLISSMISLALVIPLTMISLMTFITSAILTFNFSATSAILSQTSLERASVHLKFFAISMSLAWTILKISLALVTPFAIASRIILSTSAALILNNSAASRNFLHISAERTSSQVMTLMSAPSTPGKKCFLISSMISLALVIPLTMISLMTFITSAILTLIRA